MTRDLSKKNEHLGPYTPKNLVLASTSRYRAQLLNRLGYPFDRVDPAVDETPQPAEEPAALALRLSIAKALSTKTPSDAWVLGSDQVLAYRGKILGKPGTRERAIAQLARCSGATVNFYTGVCLSNRRLGFLESHLVTTQVTFRTLTAENIEHYVDQEPAFDCAGSFKVEGLGISLFTEVSSSDPTALEGLPLISVCSMLRKTQLLR